MEGIGGKTGRNCEEKDRNREQMDGSWSGDRRKSHRDGWELEGKQKGLVRRQTEIA